MDRAFVTLATNDPYCLGALAVAASLRIVDTQHAIVCMIAPEVTANMRRILEKAFDQVYLVDVLDSRDTKNLFLLERPDLGVTFTKLHCWRLEQYKKCVFLDADTLVLRNCDELFEREEFSAAPDPGWPDCFNSGVFVYVPSKETYNKLVQFAVEEGSFDGGDQGLLNLYFSDWAHTDISKHLPFLYNVVSQAFYSYLPAFKRFGSQTKICHFIGAVKPWNHTYDHNTGAPKSLPGTGFNSEFLSRWWQIFVSNVFPLMRSTLPQIDTEHKESASGGTATRGPPRSLKNHQESNILPDTPKAEITCVSGGVSTDLEVSSNCDSLNSLPVSDFLSSVSKRSLSAVSMEMLIEENNIEKSDEMFKFSNGEPENLAEVPEIPTGVLEIPTGVPEIPTGVPEIPTGVLEIPTGVLEIPKDDLYNMWSSDQVPYRTPQCSFENILAHINKSIYDAESKKDWDDAVPSPPITKQEELIPQLSGFSVSGSPSATPMARHKSTVEHQGDWERGIIDYTGVDSFENIKKHLDTKLAEPQPPPVPKYVKPVVPQATLVPSTASNSTITTADKSTVKPIKGVLKKTKQSSGS